MKITKKHLCELPSCYAASSVRRDGRTLLLLAPDAPGPCYAFDSESYERETVWEKGGGTMAMAPAPGENGDFLAIQDFNPGFQAQDAKIVYVQNRAGKWSVTPIFKLPYVHRFDILERNGIKYILCATLCTTKASADDWSSPGGLYAVELPEDLSQPIEPDIIAIKMTRNHGFWRVKNNGYTSALTSCDQGIFEVKPPSNRDGNWLIERIMTAPASDIALCDIDGDGIDEMAAIEPFHGSRFNIYRRAENGFSLLYSYPNRADFLHVAWGGKLRGEPAFIGGCRGGNKELFLLRRENGKIICELIDKGAGPANVCVINGDDKDFILTANHESGEGVVYEVGE